MGVRVIPSNPRKSNENVAHERVHRVLREELFALLPGSEDGLRDDRGELLPDSRPLISLAEARDLLDRWAWAYNTRAKKGASRMDAWVEEIDLSAGLLPHRETPKTLARYAIERKHTAKRYALGVLVDTVYYTCPELEEVTNKRFVVRQWLRDERTVELFTPAGTYIGVAAANGQLTAAESGAIQKSAEDARRLRAEVTAASRSKDFVSAFPDVPIRDNGTLQESAGGGADSLPAQSPLSALADALRNRVDRGDLVSDEEGAP